MANYKISLNAKEDLRRIYNFGIAKFGVGQADKYFNAFFDNFEKIAHPPPFIQICRLYKKKLSMLSLWLR